MRLYTRGGDQGETGLFGGERVLKNHVRVTAYGDVDELNAMLGWAAAACADADWRSKMQEIQAELFTLGAELANPRGRGEAPAVTPQDAEVLERWIDAATDAVEPLRQFVLPGGTELASRLHLARTVCRRAERCVVSLSQAEHVAPMVIVYLNRLSDLLFAWARWANTRENVADVAWSAPHRA